MAALMVVVRETVMMLEILNSDLLPDTHYAEERWIIVWEEGFGRSSVVVVRRQSGHDG